MAELENRLLVRSRTISMPPAIVSCHVVEPLVSTQWFVKMKPLAEPAITPSARGM